ncbi:MAG TPA: Rid family hydrolase [Longimicrobiales bacterium]
MRTAHGIAVLVIALSACAHEPVVERRYINLPNRNVNAPFSDGVMVGNTLYLAGRLGLDPQTGKPPADPAVEARLVLEGFRAVLAEAGMTMNDMVSVQVFCPDVTLFDTWNQVYRTFFSQPFPARAFIGSGPLLFGARFEMQGIAVRR